MYVQRLRSFCTSVSGSSQWFLCGILSLWLCGCLLFSKEVEVLLSFPPKRWGVRPGPVIGDVRPQKLCAVDFHDCSTIYGPLVIHSRTLSNAAFTPFCQHCYRRQRGLAIGLVCLLFCPFVCWQDHSKGCGRVCMNIFIRDKDRSQPRRQVIQKSFEGFFSIAAKLDISSHIVKLDSRSFTVT